MFDINSIYYSRFKLKSTGKLTIVVVLLFERNVEHCALLKNYYTKKTFLCCAAKIVN